MNFGAENVCSGDEGRAEHDAIAAQVERASDIVEGEQADAAESHGGGDADVPAEPGLHTSEKGDDGDDDGGELAEEGAARCRGVLQADGLHVVDKDGPEAELHAGAQDGAVGRGFFGGWGFLGWGGAEELREDEEGGQCQTYRVEKRGGNGPVEAVEPLDANAVRGPEERDEEEEEAAGDVEANAEHFDGERASRGGGGGGDGGGGRVRFGGRGGSGGGRGVWVFRGAVRLDGWEAVGGGGGGVSGVAADVVEEAETLGVRGAG